ncbi:hypothetical protein [Dictyobacter formicarum]|uniref:Uncharacterized protein n=1 Tax=Dictyobacter formicarum TaxID=2778368 RepID=A0ABQ3VGU9_9CHLR|nr:hypothetical protein [Dictyobacter formicarum]GHO85255.1 hypothetical protein KSZ_32610 [Dictyobacter formicarum]
MGLYSEFAKLLKIAEEQILPTKAQWTRGIYYTRNFYTKARQWGLTEEDAADVYRHGEVVKPNMMLCKYNGYAIGIYYYLDKRSGKPVITSIWKQKPY